MKLHKQKSGKSDWHTCTRQIFAVAFPGNKTSYGEASLYIFCVFLREEPLLNQLYR